VVSGPAGQKLYFNGALVGTNDYQGSFSSLRGQNNYLGKSTYRSGEPTTRGQIDELRVWNHERTAEQIHSNLFTALTGAEPGLEGYWNFDDPAHPGSDLSPGGHAATFHGGAKVVEGDRPAELDQLTVLTGTLTDSEGKPASGAFVEIKQGTNFTRNANADTDGRYRVTFYPSNQPVTLRVFASDCGAWRTNLLFAGGEINLDLALGDATSLSGKVVALDDSPLANVVVQALRTVGHSRSQPALVSVRLGGAGAAVRLS
jgi:hypothetical protein